MRGTVHALWAGTIASLASTVAIALELPQLPAARVAATYSAPRGKRHVVKAGGNLQAAIDQAAPGDAIVIEAGATFEGPFTLSRKPGDGWIQIQSSALERLPPPGTRVGPGDAPNMPRITVRAGHGAAIQTDRGAHHFRLVGLDVRPGERQFVYNLVDIGRGQSSEADFPRDIIIDRCLIRGDASVGGRRGVAMNGIRVAVVDSHVADFKEAGADTQALWTYDTPGPLLVANNYLEAAGENFMSGGADSRLPDIVPSDIEIRGNLFRKPLSWLGQRWTVKNLFELKTGRRVLVEGNVFENSWPAADQAGYALVLTPRNETGKSPWGTVEDVTFRLNRLSNVGQGIALSGRDTNYPSKVSHRVLIENNVFVVTKLGNAGGRGFLVTNGPVDLTIRHNTVIIPVEGGTTAFIESDPKADRFTFVANLVSSGAYGFIGSGTGPGNATLERYFSNAVFRDNAIIGGSGNYPPGNHFPVSPMVVRFVDYEGGNYRLAPGSPFRRAAQGKDIGADVDALEAATANAMKGVRANP